jgi:lipopolysaccharide/colanic/teichoic acid biosynthesis glycosyltransferase
VSSAAFAIEVNHRRTAAVLRRALDVTVSLAVLFVTLPLALAIAVAIKGDSRGSVFYGCRRIGYRGEPFTMLKFRKMRESASGPAITAQCDVRFTRVGRVLARTKLDELPQLLNVLRGDMSLVGPRPEDASFVALHTDAYEAILSVRPGITGLSQLAFAKESDVLGDDDPIEVYIGRVLPQKVQIDWLYARSRSLATDLRILVWTALAVVLRQDVSVNRVTGALTLRRRRSQRTAA